MKLFFTFLLSCSLLGAVDLIWLSGGELGAVGSNWGSPMSGTIVSDRVRTGSFSIKINGSSQAWTADFATGITELWTRCYVQPDVITGTLETVWQLRDGADAVISDLRMDTDGTMTLEGTSSTGTIGADAWHLIETRYKPGTGADAQHQLWIDGVSEVNLSNGAQEEEPIAMDFESFDAATADTWYDDCSISSTGRIGAGEIIALQPNADASPDTFVVVGGSDPSWDDVDESPGDNFSRARAPTSGGPPVGQEWDLTTITIGTINASFVWVEGFLGAGGGGSETVRPNGTNDLVNYTDCTSGTELVDDPDSPDTTYCNGLGTDVDADVDVEFATPTTSPNGTTDAQEIRACFVSTGQASDPTCTVSIMEGNTLRIADIIDTTISQTTCAAVQAANFTFDSAVWTDDTGAALAVRAECTAGGGSPAGRASGMLGAVEWNVATSSSTTHKLIANDDNNSDLLLGPDLGLVTGSNAFYSLKVTGAAVPVSQADVDAYEIGMEQSVAGDPKGNIDAIWLMIDHAPAVAGGKRRVLVNLIAALVPVFHGPGFAGITR